jgi:uncharacterized protein (DUF58 family)
MKKMSNNLKVSDEILAKAKLIQTKASFLVNDLFSGEYSSTFRGRGIEFEEVREYLEGDDVRNIDWKVSARTQNTYVKVYKDERELTLFFVVDVSGSALFGSGGKTKEEVIAEITALLSYAAQKNNDKVALVIFSDNVEHYIPAGKGKAHIWKIIRDILSFIPSSRSTNISTALDFVSKVRKRRSVVFVISDFISQDFEKSFGLLCSRHEVVAIHVADQMESRFPAIGHVYLRDLENKETILLNTEDPSVREHIKSQSRELEDGMISLCKKHRGKYLKIHTTDDYLNLIVKFFVKQHNPKSKGRK